MIAMNNGRVIFTLNAVKIVPLMSAMDVSSGHSSLKGRKQNIIGANTVRDVSRLWWTLGGRSNSFVQHGWQQDLFRRRRNICSKFLTFVAQLDLKSP